MRLEVRFRVPGYALAGEKGLWLVPPGARHPLRFPSLAPYLDAADLEQRTQALQFGAPRMVEYVETIALPSGFKVARLPRDRSLDGKAASLATTAKVEKGKLVYSFQLVVKRHTVAVADYGNFREVIREVRSLPEDPVALAREGK